jgi:hypothetical protein
MIFPRRLYVVVSVDCWRLDSTHHAYKGEVLALTDDEASERGVVPLRLDPGGLADLLDHDAVEALAKLLLPALKAKLEPAPLPADATPRRRAARAV